MSLTNVFVSLTGIFDKLYSLANCGRGLFRFYFVKSLWFSLFYMLKRLIKHVANYMLPVYFRLTKKSFTEGNSDVIVSLTSFPARINKVWLCIETLKRQTLRPKKVILYLSSTQFKDIEIPRNLLSECDELFEIRFVKGDLRSHKKYYYAFQDFSNYLIVLVDDDLFYPTNLVSNLFNKYNNCTTNNNIFANYCREITYDIKGNLKDYNSWPLIKKTSNVKTLFFGSGGGTLINPRILYKDVCDDKLFMNLTPLADDIWLNAMCRLNDVSIVMIGKSLVLPIIIPHNKALLSLNMGQNMNDRQILNVIEYYQNKLGINPFEINI
jgi:hypothetical protein